MLNKLKKIPLLGDLHISSADGTVLMKTEGRAARGYLCTHSFVLAIFIDTLENFPQEAVRYITLLLAGCPDIHDYSLQLSSEGGGLCCYYDKNMTAEIMAAEIEKHLALTRYLASRLSCYQRYDRRGNDEVK
ncbi:pathogenicity island protein [Yersinia aldovae]|uniref:pathogenicity island protein n=1 Tax=Yersinia aldovae TaxID=29483 RepID=UPI0011AA6DF7|nr:pathogenicity island protein [Yersinia aldovae]